MHRFSTQRTMIAIDFTSTAAIMAGICVAVFGIQMAFACGLYSRLHRYFNPKAAEEPAEWPPLSVIVVTKDTGDVLEQNLTALLEQAYPEFEVIVINDQSAGEDELTLKILAMRYPNLYHTFIPESARYVSRKKLSIAMGIRASHYEWIVVTSPFARPDSDQWLKSLAREMTPETDVVLGYSGYTHQKGHFALRVRAASFFRSLRYLNWALAGHPYMGVGINLAYRKSVYQAHKGFSNHLQLQRGEDDLLVNAIANGRNTRVARGAESIVRLPVPAKRAWREEKMGMMATARFLRGMVPRLNAFETITCGLFHLMCLATLAVGVMDKQWIPAGVTAACWLTRELTITHIWYHTAWGLKEKFGFFLPVFDVCRPSGSLICRVRFWVCRKDAFLRK